MELFHVHASCNYVNSFEESWKKNCLTCRVKKDVSSVGYVCELCPRPNWPPDQPPAALPQHVIISRHLAPVLLWLGATSTLSPVSAGAAGQCPGSCASSTEGGGGIDPMGVPGTIRHWLTTLIPVKQLPWYYLIINMEGDVNRTPQHCRGLNCPGSLCFQSWAAVRRCFFSECCIAVWNSLGLVPNVWCVQRKLYYIVFCH